MSTKLTTKKNSRTAASDITKPAEGKKRSAAKVTKEAKPKTVKAKSTTTTMDDNLTIVEIPPAAVETVGATKKTAKRTNKKATAKPKAGLSQLDVAAKVLGESTEPLSTKQMVEAMAAKGYWTSPGGKTPHATLYSSILRELQTKADTSRFVKTDRGHFRLRTP